MPRIVVMGASGREMLLKVAHHPNVNHPVLADSFEERTSGRGARQAAACSRLRGQVSLISAVGSDGSERAVLEDMQDQRVNMRSSKVIRGAQTMREVTLRMAFGGQSRVVYPGACAMLTSQHVLEASKTFQGVACALFQLELPVEAVMEGMRCAKRAGAVVLLDPYPATGNLPPEIWSLTQVVLPNAEEMARITGKDDPDEGAGRLMDLGVQAVAAHLGPLGAILYSRGSRPRSFQAFRVDTVDHDGAGDAFAAGVTVALSEGMDMEEAVRFGCAAGALACTREGTLNAFPARQQVEGLLVSQPSPGRT
ncbi:carbohydrate kinase family protein [Thermanaerovibrio acidaminovorans]|uniref:carbohydrate kinase family protein n=1 Tax=Thermanaerovibrio acidaminovorans TaxID=81462 RepID=UPI002490F0FA|nr:PfkB family carbohydrate kinase [Thermanaerovibrio acidaminovorans]